MVNIVELVAEDQAQNQPCAHGNYCDGHAVYCHNEQWADAPRKCRRTWYTNGEVTDESCPGFSPNPNFQSAFVQIAPPLVACQKCKGARLIKAGRQPMTVETCPRCQGDGAEPQPVALSKYEMGVLEWGDRGPYLVERETDEELESIQKLKRLGLIRIISTNYLRSTTVELLELTGKGRALLHMKWKIAE